MYCRIVELLGEMKGLTWTTYSANHHNPIGANTAPRIAICRRLDILLAIYKKTPGAHSRFRTNSPFPLPSRAFNTPRINPILHPLPAQPHENAHPEPEEGQPGLCGCEVSGEREYEGEDGEEGVEGAVDYGEI